MFTRLIYFAVGQLHYSEAEAWLMPIGYLMDLWECHLQFIGHRKPKQYRTIDDVIPFGI